MAGQLTVKNLQLGNNATATQNFVWSENSDGTAKLARGNVGATTQDILTVDASGLVTFTQQALFSANPAVYSKVFTSADQSITGGAGFTVAHGLGAVPIRWDFHIRCTVADNGYSVGDILINAMFANGGPGVYGVTLTADATNITGRFVNNAVPFGGVAKGTGNGVSFTNASWVVVVKAWL